MDDRSLKFAILNHLSKPGPWHESIRNLIGTPFQPGNLERNLNVTFDIDMRGKASRAVESLVQCGLVRQTFMDMINPEGWIQISEAGQDALTRHALDELDQLLHEVSPGLSEIRDGAWQRLSVRTDDSIRQAAHSARELINQVLRILIPKLPDMPDESKSEPGATRKAKVRAILKLRNAKVSNSRRDVVEALANLVDSLYSRLSAEAHRTVDQAHKDVTDLLLATEVALRQILRADV